MAEPIKLNIFVATHVTPGKVKNAQNYKTSLNIFLNPRKIL